MFSDGITEAENRSGEDFGETRLLEAICNNWDASTRKLCDAVLVALSSFLGDLDPQDDQTLVIARLQPSLNELASDDLLGIGRLQRLGQGSTELVCQ